MGTLNLNIETGSASFEPGAEWAEIGRILRELANRFDGGALANETVELADIHGHKVGELTTETDGTDYTVDIAGIHTDMSLNGLTPQDVAQEAIRQATGEATTTWGDPNREVLIVNRPDGETFHFSFEYAGDVLDGYSFTVYDSEGDDVETGGDHITPVNVNEKVGAMLDQLIDWINATDDED